MEDCQCFKEKLKEMEHSFSRVREFVSVVASRLVVPARVFAVVVDVVDEMVGLMTNEKIIAKLTLKLEIGYFLVFT